MPTAVLIEVLIEQRETGPETCSIHTTVSNVMGKENGRHLKDGLQLGGAISYIRLFCLPCHSYVTATVLGKQVPACIHNNV